MGRRGKRPNEYEQTVLFCCGCSDHTFARKVGGNVIYPHRPDLSAKQFYQCPKCGNYVGTHADGRPLGTIPTSELIQWRSAVHSAIDPIWIVSQNRRAARRELYSRIAEHLGIDRYHTGDINSIEVAQKVIEFATKNY